MTADSFKAVESVTGDTITGVVFDNTSRYSVGSAVTTGPDNLGGGWTYTVTGITAADAAHQSTAFNGVVYDVAYLDADAGKTYSTTFGTLGLAFASPNAFTSGTNYLGSDRDFIQVGASLVLIGGNAVLPDTNGTATPNAQTSAFPAGNDPSGPAQAADLALLNNFAAASFVPAGSGTGSSSPIDPTVQQTLLTSPHA